MTRRAKAPGVLGIDFGTSNSAVAWGDSAETATPIALEGEATALPTALFFNGDEHRVQFGRDAIREYLAGTDGRLMRSLKSLLGSPLMHEQTVVNGQQIAFQDIITRFLQELRVRAQAQMGGELARRVVMGRPVHFVDDDPERDALAQETLRLTAQAAGFDEVSFQLEPIAAALDYERRVDDERVVLVTDIGGGTSDFTVVRLGPQRLRRAHARAAKGHANPRADDILATTGVHIGGTDFDQRLSVEEFMPLLGLRHIGPTGREVPSSVFFDLATWHLINWRYSPRAMREAEGLRENYSDPRLHDRLMAVLHERLGHRIAHEVELAKIACSGGSDAARVDLSEVEPALHARVTRDALGRHLAEPLARVVACAQDCVARAGLRSDQLDGIYLTGGSSALQPFQRALQEAFPDTALIEGDLFGGVAAGLACSGFWR